MVADLACLQQVVDTESDLILEKLARKFPDVKFLQILYTDCIPNYPEKNLPTLLVYRDDDLLTQFVGLSVFGGSSYGIDGTSRSDSSPQPFRVHVVASSPARLRLPLV